MCDWYIKILHRSYASTLLFLLHLFILFGNLVYVHSAYAWIDFAKAGDESPPVLCMLETGNHSVYTKIQYQIQARYHTWMADWSMQRPTGYARDEATGFLVRDDVQNLLVTLLNLGIPHFSTVTWQKRATLKPTDSSSHSKSISNTSSTQESYYDDDYCKFNASPPSDKNIVVVLKVRIPPFNQLQTFHTTPWYKHVQTMTHTHTHMLTDEGWLIWHFTNPYHSLDGRAEKMIRLIKTTIEAVSQKPFFIDKLILKSELGVLDLRFQAPITLWINEILYGTLKRPIRLPLAQGIYNIKTQFVGQSELHEYNKIEIIADKTTRLRLRF